MIDEKKFAEIAAEAADCLRESSLIRSGFETCESEIEKLMFVGLVNYVPMLLGLVEVEIIPQMKIDRYRVDFMISAKLYGGKRLEVVVECDGHAYHEKTKEQAARDKQRDRDLTSRGYRVMRFAGSEIWSSAFSCAREAFAIVEMGQVEAIEEEMRKRGKAA